VNSTVSQVFIRDVSPARDHERVSARSATETTTLRWSVQGRHEPPRPRHLGRLCLDLGLRFDMPRPMRGVVQTSHRRRETPGT
jgi:phosphatidate phosphatase APP1